MTEQPVTFTNQLAELIGPLLLLIRSTGFFEAHVFIPIMTSAGAVIFCYFVREMRCNGTFTVEVRRKVKWPYLFLIFAMCFLLMNSSAVALKTMIAEETDYEVMPWFLWLVGPLHIYMSTVSASYLWLVWRNEYEMLDGALVLYVQIALFGGYYIAVYRLMNEPIEWTNPITGLSGVFFFIWFGFINWDIWIRFWGASRVQNRLLISQ